VAPNPPRRRSTHRESKEYNQYAELICAPTGERSSRTIGATQTLTRHADAPDLPDDLTATDSKLVYLFVAVSDGATIDDLQAALDVRALSERGPIERVEDRCVTVS
jgi:hypothetical protein